MNAQLPNKGGFTNNFWVQIAPLIVLSIVVIGVAAKYIW
jgi:hypothetical protein